MYLIVLVAGMKFQFSLHSIQFIRKKFQQVDQSSWKSLATTAYILIESLKNSNRKH